MQPSLAKLLALAVLCLGIFGVVSFGCQRQEPEEKLTTTHAPLAEFILEKPSTKKSISEEQESKNPASEKLSSEKATAKRYPSDIPAVTQLPSGKTIATKPTPAKPYPDWTQQSNPPKSNQQIRIETKVMEITRIAGSADIPPKKYKGVCNDQQLQELIRRKSQQAGTDVVSFPSMIVSDGETALVENIREFLYPSGPEDGAEIETENTGFTSYFEAHHLGGENILLKSFTRITEFEGFSEVNPDFSLPVFTRRDIETSDRLKNGETIVIGGVLDSKTTKIEDAYFFGLFKKSSTERFSRELIILITPTLIEPDGTESFSQ
ncbi:MAG: hypothetical protein ACSHYB_11645 [Roseibacillus sp.]